MNVTSDNNHLTPLRNHWFLKAQMYLVLSNDSGIWGKVFENGPSKIC